MQNLSEQLSSVCDRIRQAECKFNRIAGSVQLLAVSKQQPSIVIESAYALGQHSFGESYPQEALKKLADLQHLPISWHFIGPIQSNKTRILAEKFDWVHSIDRFKIAKRLNDQRPENFKPLNVCLQIKLDPEPGKAGVEPDAAAELAQAVSQLPHLQLRGLMTIPRYRPELQAQRQSFARLRMLLEQLNQRGFKLDTLSMGMSSDLEAAIAEGATIVRIGTAIFGERQHAD